MSLSFNNNFALAPILYNPFTTKSLPIISTGMFFEIKKFLTASIAS